MINTFVFEEVFEKLNKTFVSVTRIGKLNKDCEELRGNNYRI